MSVWEDFIDSIRDQAGTLAKDELKDLIRSYKNDGDAFLKKQGNKMQRYITQLAQGEITKEEFAQYIEDIKDLTEMEKNRMAAAAKARAQRLINSITTLFIDGLIKLL